MILRQVYIIESHTAFSERNVTLYNGSRKPNSKLHKHLQRLLLKRCIEQIQK